MTVSMFNIRITSGEYTGLYLRNCAQDDVPKTSVALEKRLCVERAGADSLYDERAHIIQAQLKILGYRAELLSSKHCPSGSGTK